jgi:hypothetical protein
VTEKGDGGFVLWLFSGSGGGSWRFAALGFQPHARGSFELQGLSSALPNRPIVTPDIGAFLTGSWGLGQMAPSLFFGRNLCLARLLASLEFSGLRETLRTPEIPALWHSGAGFSYSSRDIGRRRVAVRESRDRADSSEPQISEETSLTARPGAIDTGDTPHISGQGQVKERAVEGAILWHAVIADERERCVAHFLPVQIFSLSPVLPAWSTERMPAHFSRVPAR